MAVAFHEHLFNVLAQDGFVMRFQVGHMLGVHAWQWNTAHGVPQGFAGQFAKQAIIVGGRHFCARITLVYDVDFVDHVQNEQENQQDAPNQKQLKEAVHATLLAVLKISSGAICSCTRSFFTTEDKI